MYAMNMSEVLQTLAAFAEMLDVIESIEGLFSRKTYTSQCEPKDSAFETWATESSGISADLTNDSRSNESTSSRSSSSNDNILDDCCIVPEIPTANRPLTSFEDSGNNVEDRDIIDPFPILNVNTDKSDSNNTKKENKSNKLNEYSAINDNPESNDSNNSNEENENKNFEECLANSNDSNGNGIPENNDSNSMIQCSTEGNESNKLEECSANSSDSTINDNPENNDSNNSNEENESKKVEECLSNGNDSNGSGNPENNDSNSMIQCSTEENERNKLEECSTNSSDSIINYNPETKDSNNSTEENKSNILEECLANSSDSNINFSKVNGEHVEKVCDVNRTFKPKEADDTIDIHSKKKFTTSSWNLEAITESLYALEQAVPSKIFPEDSIFQGTVLVMSQGAFCKYPEGIYTLVLQQHTLQIFQETTTLMAIPLTYAEVYEQQGDILKVDNKLGKCLYFKSQTQQELKELKEELELHCSKCWNSERLNLVHYPLKCHKNVVIIDLGSCSTRAGILMDQPTLPFLFFPSICAVNKKTGNPVYGKEALQLEVRQNSNLSFPLRPSIKIVKHSIDVDLIGGLFKRIFHDLRVDPINYTVQVCLPRSLSIAVQNALVKLLLEEIKVQSVSLTHQALLTLYAHNVSTGIVVDVGDRMDILPVVDGFIVESGVTRLPYGGQRLIHHMKHALAEKQISLSNDIESFVVQYISENLCYVAEDYDAEERLVMQHPDIVKKTIALETFTRDDKCAQYATLDDARFKTPEGLFKPDLWGLDNPGIHKLVQKAIQATSVDVRKKIAENIYVSGGVTLIPGFVERLIKEVSILNKPRIVPKVIASNYRYHCTYIGACEFARMEVFPKVCVNIEEYSKNQISSLKKFVMCF